MAPALGMDGIAIGKAPGVASRDQCRCGVSQNSEVGCARDCMRERQCISHLGELSELAGWLDCV